MKVLFINTSHLIKIEKYLLSDFWEIIFFQNFDFQIYQLIIKLLEKKPDILNKIYVFEKNLYTNKLKTKLNFINEEINQLSSNNIKLNKIFSKIERKVEKKNKIKLLKNIIFFILKASYLYIDDFTEDIDNDILKKIYNFKKIKEEKIFIFLDNFGLLNQKNKKKPTELHKYKDIFTIYIPNVTLNLLFVIGSCKKNIELKNAIENTYLNKVNELGFININYLYVIGDQYEENFKNNNLTSIENENNLLIVKNNDNYETLSNKILLSYKYILSNDKFNNIDKIIKIDDDIYIDIINLFKIDIGNISYGGHISSNKVDDLSNYYIVRGKGKDEVPFTFKGEWATGGCYILNYSLLKKIEKDIDLILNSNEKIFFEDQLIARLLFNYKIKPTYIDNHLLLFLEGIPSLKIVKKNENIFLKLLNYNDLNKICYHLDFMNLNNSNLRNKSLNDIFMFINDNIEKKYFNNLEKIKN